MLPDGWAFVYDGRFIGSQCTYRCVVLPDEAREHLAYLERKSQCTYRCVVLPDLDTLGRVNMCLGSLNAPTGAWCSLTRELSPWPSAPR